jgi:hypothetical protein
MTNFIVKTFYWKDVLNTKKGSPSKISMLWSMEKVPYHWERTSVR